MNAEVCDQCGKCPSACPVTARVEGFNPRQMIAKFSLGREDDLTESGAIWTCTSCLKCKERCPEEISPYEVILALRRRAIAEGRQHPVSYDEAERAVTGTGVIQQPQPARTRGRDRKDRAAMGLPPAQRPRDQAKFTQAINEMKKEASA
jgi:heterodisulfide reductase subunit C